MRRQTQLTGAMMSDEVGRWPERVGRRVERDSRSRSFGFATFASNGFVCLSADDFKTADR